MPAISLTTFLKILTKGTPQKVQEYSKYLTPGGYDFYWQLKDAAHCHTVDGKPFADCAEPIQAITRDVERMHNLDGFKSLAKWIKKLNVTKFFDPPSHNCSSPEGFLTVKLEPEFGTIINGQRRIVQLWNSKGAVLTKTAAGVGIYLLEKHLAVGEFADCKGAILDLRKCELLVADKLPANVEAMVGGEFAWVDSFFKAQKKAA